MPTRVLSRAVHLTLAGAALGLLAGGFSAAVAGDSDPQVNPHASTAMGEPNVFAAHVNPSGPGLSSAQAIGIVTGSLHEAGVTSAGLIEPPYGSTGSLWISVDVDNDLGDDLLPNWLAMLTEGAIADLMHTDEATTHDVIGGAQLVDSNKAGQVVTIPLGYGAVVAGQDFRSPSDAALRDRVDQVAARYGLGVSSVEVLRPLDSALEVTLTVPNGGVDWTIAQLLASLRGDPPSIEGVYLELDSESGEPLLRTTTAFRFGGGGLWFAPGQDDRFAAFHG